MEEQLSFVQQLFGDLSQGHSGASLITCVIIAAIGYMIMHGRSVNKGIKSDNNKPIKFNFKVWFKENIIPVLTFIAIVYLYVIMSDYFLQLAQNIEIVKEYPWLKNSLDIILGAEIVLSLAIGLFYDYIGQKGIRKFVKFIVKKIKKLGGKK